MDTFMFVVALLIMMLAVQFGENWLMFAVVAITILTLRSLTATVVLVVSAVALYIARPVLMEYWPFVFFGLIILALVLGSSPEAEGGQPEYYSPDTYSGLMQGGGY